MYTVDLEIGKSEIYWNAAVQEIGFMDGLQTKLKQQCDAVMSMWTKSDQHS